MCMCVSPGHAFEVAVAAGVVEEGEEDGEVVGGVDEGGAGYGAGADADKGEDEGVAAGGGEVPLDAVGEGAQPEEREEEPGGDEGGDVGEALGCDEELRLHDGGNDLLRVVIARR